MIQLKKKIPKINIRNRDFLIIWISLNNKKNLKKRKNLKNKKKAFNKNKKILYMFIIKVNYYQGKIPNIQVQIRSR